MVLSISSSYHAIRPNLSVYVTGIGGVEPYTYSVIAGGAGGSINSLTGQYTSPAILPLNPAFCYDTIQVTDATLATATFQMLVGSPIVLVCDILQTQLNVDNNHIYLWDQKIFEPTDSLLYVVVGIVNSKPFGSTNLFQSGLSVSSNQSVNVLDVVSVDLLSRSTAALFQRYNALMAFNSTYAESQKELNSFYTGVLPSTFVNISKIDGAAIPYRFRFHINLQYFVNVIESIQYYDTFPPVEIITNP